MKCRRSASCLACRASKVKCDLRKPSCSRCERQGRPCPGYEDPWEAIHRSENAAAAHHVAFRVARRLREREVTAGGGGGGENSAALAFKEIVRKRSAVPKPLQIDSEFVWLQQFYSNFACTDELSFFSILSDFRESGATSAAFNDVIRATALANCGVQMRQAGLMALARRYYGSAIAKINMALQDPTTAQDDSVAVALLALCIYEGTVPEALSRMTKSHCRGSLILLRYRADQEIASSLDSRLLAFSTFLEFLGLFVGLENSKLAFSPVQKNSLWTRYGVVEPLLVRVIEFKEMVDSVKASIKRREAPITGILLTGLDIVRELEVAANFRITSPGPRRTAQQSGAMGEASNCFVYLLSRSCSATEAMIKGMYLTVKLQVMEFILGLSIVHGEPSAEELSILVRLPHGLTAVEQVCEQIRVVFGLDGREPASGNQGIGFKAWCMFWCMVAVLKSGFADRDTKLWITDKLIRVGQASGFGLLIFEMGWFNTGSVETSTFDYGRFV
ncbi:hypothetical protein LX32DRAFT_603046 [Colletotrichum zoysiae]|uniref:Zn(2)-C6 fungal-type domain-containing protein n=1 Tax=Colletotrichum zoysiae TaxID=1216348 RepID=A0AAD9H4J4_9PEZI|nr:hypothetical protein LX32DRAFT_603046 [Colletotrichum zoysiae]